jgi:hypothetical protein
MKESLKHSPFADFDTPNDSHAQDEVSPDMDEESFAPFDPAKTTSMYHIHQSEEAMTTLKQVFRDQSWKKMNSHRSVTTWMKPGITKDDKIPVFKGEGVVRGFEPRSIFTVISMRALWDEW